MVFTLEQKLADIRCMCRACRLTKCIEVGMNPVGVRQKPGSFRKSKELISPSSSNHDEFSRMPILSKMKLNYENMRNARKALHNEVGENVFEEKIPKEINYKESVQQGMKDYTLMPEWVSSCFDEFRTLSADQKNILFRNSYIPFFMMETAFLSHINNMPDSVIFPSGDYCDMKNLERYYNSTNFEKKISTEDIENLFKPFYDNYKRSLLLPMMNLQVDIYEFLTLFTLLHWDTGLVEITDECLEIGTKVKAEVFKELDFYLTNVKKVAEPSVRIGTIVNLLPAVHKSVRRIQDDMEMTKVFNIFSAPNEFFDLVTGNF
ncbi:NR LBD domain-containing protein [Caenorhabditis elegans]|uniref:NR LBD domain-containing protein n=1 Tax=Caenorhabditis elegans TaxID=6239 RepID=Q7JP54_CAEEL|nr:NR LBD domain-containing protein [Caenorhabditis elegans]CCD73611.1 NR LBD domain-containing protein [Caenorhabditis elegans]|eukprot:NP_001022341.1 Nuclear Hormone Receptor family [Caenorhabditis elegans]